MHSFDNTSAPSRFVSPDPQGKGGKDKSGKGKGGKDKSKGGKHQEGKSKSKNKSTWSGKGDGGKYSGEWGQRFHDDSIEYRQTGIFGEVEAVRDRLRGNYPDQYNNALTQFWQDRRGEWFVRWRNF